MLFRQIGDPLLTDSSACHSDLPPVLFRGLTAEATQGISMVMFIDLG